MPGLLSLLEEILCIVSDFVHPQTVIDSRYSLEALEIHKQRRPEFRVVHDRSPVAIQ